MLIYMGIAVAAVLFIILFTLISLSNSRQSQQLIIPVYNDEFNEDLITDEYIQAMNDRFKKDDTK